MSFRGAVNQNKIVNYEEHLKSPDLFNLKAAAASLCTLAEEYRESVDAKHTTKVRKFIETTILELQEFWEFDEQEKANIKKVLLSNFMANFGYAASLTAQDAMALLKITDTMTKTAERAAKIQDGVTYKLEWSDKLIETLTMLLERCVLPYVPKENRVQIAMACKDFFSSAKQSIINGKAPTEFTSPMPPPGKVEIKTLPPEKPKNNLIPLPEMWAM